MAGFWIGSPIHALEYFPALTVDVTGKAMSARASLVINGQGFCQAMFLPPRLYFIEVNVYVYLYLILALLNGDSASEVFHDNDSPFSTVDFCIYGFSDPRPHEQRSGPSLPCPSC